MAFTEQNKADAYLFFALAFNAAPGKQFGAQIVQAYEAGMTTADIVAQYVSKPDFLKLYPATQTAAEFAAALTGNVAATSTSAAVKAAAIADIQKALAAGMTKAQVIVEILGNLAKKAVTDTEWGTTVAQLNNKIAVAKVLTEGAKALDTTDAALLQGPLKGVTEDVATVAKALNSAGDLLAKLENLTATKKAATDYVKSLDLVGATDLVTAKSTVTTNAETASKAVHKAADPAATTVLSTDASTKAAQIALAQANVAAKLKAEQKAQVDYEAALATIISAKGVSALTVLKNDAAATAAQTAANNAKTLAANAVNKVIGDVNVGAALAVAYTPPTTAVAYLATTVITVGSTTVAKFDTATKAFTFEAGVTAANKTLVQPLVDAANTQYKAIVAAEGAATNVVTAAAEVTDFTVPAGATVTFAAAFTNVKDSAGATVTVADAAAAKTTLPTLAANIKTATEAQAKLVADLAKVNAADATLAQIKTLSDNVDAANKAFTDAGYQVPVEAKAALFATDKDDVFLVTANSNAASIFGFAGKDTLYVGKGYALGADMAKGDDTKLEVFFKTSATGTDVYVEQKAFGSSSADQVKDIVKITLTGVAADKVTLKDGFVTVAA